jgi:hypothetical protein
VGDRLSFDQNGVNRIKATIALGTPMPFVM